MHYTSIWNFFVIILVSFFPIFRNNKTDLNRFKSISKTFLWTNLMKIIYSLLSDFLDYQTAEK